MDKRTYFLVTIIINVFVMGSCDSCPYEDPACSCYDNIVTCVGLNTVPPLKSSTSGIDTVRFVDGNLTTIPADSLPPNLYSFTLDRVPISYIDPDAFQSSAYTLRELTIRAIKMDDLPDAILAIKNLTSLSLSNTKFKGNNLTALQHVGKTVQKLYIDEAYYDYFKPEFYKFFTVLSEIYVADYTNAVFPEDTYMSVAGTLKTLYLKISSFPSFKNVFSGLRLINLTLDKNEIGSDGDNLATVLLPLSGSLQHLAITNNDLRMIPDLSRMSSLLTLDLNRNAISDITPDKLPVQLKYLNLFFNRIMTLTDANFRNGSYLEILNISGNPLNYISPSAFQNAQNLRILVMVNTNLTALINLGKAEQITLGIHITCPCPRDQRLVQWYRSLKHVTISGRCQPSLTVEDYISADNPCYNGGDPRTAGVPFLYILFLIATSIWFSFRV